MIKKTFLMLSFFGLYMFNVSCHSKPDFSSSTISISSLKTAITNSPYEVFFKSLKTDQLTDTILVQSRVRVFGCGTAALQYRENLEKSNLKKFYDQYGDVVSEKKLIDQFEKDNNIKILWVSRGNEGELMQLEDKKLHENQKLEKRLFSKKCFVKFLEDPSTLEKVNIHVIIAFPKEGKATYSTQSLVKNKEIWHIDTIKTEEWTGDDFKRAYYP